jgi:hypothetical protein
LATTSFIGIASAEYLLLYYAMLQGGTTNARNASTLFLLVNLGAGRVKQRFHMFRFFLLHFRLGLIQLLLKFVIGISNGSNNAILPLTLKQARGQNAAALLGHLDML